MPTASQQTIDWDGRLSASIPKWLKRTWGDAYLGHHALLVRLKEKGNIIEGGLGSQIQVPLLVPMAGGPSLQGITDPTVNLPVIQMTGQTSAYYVPAEKAMRIIIAKRELKINRADTKKVDWVEGVMKMARMKSFVGIDQDIWAAEGVAGANGAAPDKFGSLRCYLNRGGSSTADAAEPASDEFQLYGGGTYPGGAAVGSSPLTNVGNIERNGPSGGFWCTPVDNPGSAATFSLTLVNNLVSLGTRNEDVPDLGIMHRYQLDKLAVLLQGQGNHNIFDNSKAMKKFNAIQYRGVTWIMDDRVPAGTSGGTGNKQIFVLNTDYLQLHMDSMEPDIEDGGVITESPRKEWLLTIYGQLCGLHLGGVHARHANVT